jgi:hypothetical protein
MPSVVNLKNIFNGFMKLKNQQIKLKHMTIMLYHIVASVCLNVVPHAAKNWTQDPLSKTHLLACLAVKEHKLKMKSVGQGLHWKVGIYLIRGISLLVWKPCSQQPTTRPCFDPDKFVSALSHPTLEIHFNVIFLSTATSPRWSLSFRLPD